MTGDSLNSSSKPPTLSRLAATVAETILGAFSEHRRCFLEITARAQQSFEERALSRLKVDSARRFGIYREAVDRAETSTRLILGERLDNRLIWVSAKAVFSALIGQRQDWDMAETFFNSVTRRLFDTVGVDPLVEFVASDFDAPPSEPKTPVYESRSMSGGAASVVEGILKDLPFSVPWRDLSGDALLVEARIHSRLRELGRPRQLDIMASTFYRGKGAYVIGRLILSAGVVVPLVLALRNSDEGLYVDAILDEENDVSILFSFTRSYFHVPVERTYDVMRFLRSLIPKKPIAELYIAMGETKQGKTELYRAMMDQLEDSPLSFEFAAGIPGLVMVVFTMPGLDIVLKVIRDEFPPEKDTTAAHIQDRYQWVYTHDRAGRLVDAQRFEHLAFPADRFAPELLKELLTECGDTVRVEGERVIVDLAYVERQLTPLNIYVRQRPEEEAIAALEEYGRSLMDLSACNIFPGDLLLKNFGVTRHGRVALYDYDELCDLTEMNFREIPEADDDDDEMMAEPFFSVGPRDVFPEEFRRFIGVPPNLKKGFYESCPEIFSAIYWRSVQDKINEGEIAEFLPYPPERRLRPERDEG